LIFCVGVKKILHSKIKYVENGMFASWVLKDFEGKYFKIVSLYLNIYLKLKIN